MSSNIFLKLGRYGAILAVLTGIAALLGIGLQAMAFEFFVVVFGLGYPLVTLLVTLGVYGLYQKYPSRIGVSTTLVGLLAIMVSSVAAVLLLQVYGYSGSDWTQWEIVMRLLGEVSSIFFMAMGVFLFKAEITQGKKIPLIFIIVGLIGVLFQFLEMAGIIIAYAFTTTPDAYRWVGTLFFLSVIPYWMLGSILRNESETSREILVEN